MRQRRGTDGVPLGKTSDADVVAAAGAELKSNYPLTLTPYLPGEVSGAVNSCSTVNTITGILLAPPSSSPPSTPSPPLVPASPAVHEHVFTPAVHEAETERESAVELSAIIREVCVHFL